MTKELNDFDRLVLEHLPFRSAGLSVAELADGLLAKNTSGNRERIKKSLWKIDERFGPLVIQRGRDEFMRWQVSFYALPVEKRAEVEAACAEARPPAERGNCE